MKTKQFLYNLNYPTYEKEMCEIEIRSLFKFDLKEKVFLHNIKIHPSISPYLKNRLEIMYKTSTFSEVLEWITKNKIAAPDFMVKYVELTKDEIHFKQRRDSCKKIGLIIEGFPSFDAPKNTFGITFYKGSWYFGKLAEKGSSWKEHNNKPKTYSSSLGINTAKALINIAGNGDVSRRLIDPCCGVGTVLLEGVLAGYDITGVEINSKIAEDARENLRYFNYKVNVIHGDIQDIENNYDVSIIDLPYGNFSLSTDDNQLKIIRNAKRISNKIVLVSSVDISNDILNENLEIIDQCKIGKNTKRDFIRYIWVCEVVD